MSQAPAASPAPSRLQLNIAGRIAAVTKRTVNGADVWQTLVNTPAPDPYSAPGTFEIRSARRLGPEGSELAVMVDVVGIRDNYKTREGDDVKSARVILQAV